MEEAVAAAGARPLTHDDPSRSQLIALAKTGLTHRIVSQAQTPRSPIPRATRGGIAARVRRNPILLVAAAVGFVAVGFLGAKVLSNPGPAGMTAAPEVGQPVNVSAADSVPSPLAPPSPGKAPETAQKSTNAPPSNQRRVEPPAVRRDEATIAGAGAPTRDSTRPVAAQRAESSGTPVLQKAETTRAPEPILPPVVAAAETTPKTPPSSVPAVDPAREVTTVIQSYARALAASDLASARRIYAAMPTDQREGLEALWREGGTMTPNWSVTDIAITGDVATARVRGSNVVTTRRGEKSTVPVSLRARLERRGAEWRLVALVN
jgi:hypothetical protein